MITRHPTSRTLIVHPVGHLDALQADHYRQQLRSLIEEGYRFIIFDLEQTPYINSSGLGLLVELHNALRRCEGSLRLINCSEHVLWLLRQTNLDRILLKEEKVEEPAQESPEYDALHALMSEEIRLLASIHDVTEKILRLDDPDAVCRIILESVVRALRAPRGALLLLDEHEERLRMSHFYGPGHPGELEETRLKIGSLEYRTLEENDVIWHRAQGAHPGRRGLLHRLGFQTMLLTPIRGGSYNYGLLAVEAGEETGRLVQAAKPLVRTLTNLCGQSLEKISLLHELSRRKTELETALEQSRKYAQSLEDAGRLVALGAVVTGVSHLLNNKMVPLLGYAQMLAQQKDLPETVAHKVAMIHESSSDINAIMDKLVRISGSRERVRETIQPNALIGTALDLCRSLIEEGGIDVLLHLAAEAPSIEGNPDLILQALLTVLHRSCTSFGVERRDRYVRIITAAAENTLRIIVEDNGDPVDEFDSEDHIDPLVPSEAMLHGRIFNYTIPRGLVRRHRGMLKVESRTEGGKRVIIDLPLSAEIVSGS